MKTALLILAVAPALAFSATAPDLQAIMQQAQQAQQCMQNIDESAFDRIEQQGNKIEAEVKAMCANGKRDQAQQTAIDYSRKMMASDEMVQVRKCGDMLRGMMPTMPYDNFEEEFKNKHVCDEL